MILVFFTLYSMRNSFFWVLGVSLGIMSYRAVWWHLTSILQLLNRMYFVHIKMLIVSKLPRIVNLKACKAHLFWRLAPWRCAVQSFLIWHKSIPLKVVVFHAFLSGSFFSFVDGSIHVSAWRPRSRIWTGWTLSMRVVVVSYQFFSLVFTVCIVGVVCVGGWGIFCPGVEWGISCLT